MVVEGHFVCSRQRGVDGWLCVQVAETFDECFFTFYKFVNVNVYVMLVLGLCVVWVFVIVVEEQCMMWY